MASANGKSRGHQIAYCQRGRLLTNLDIAGLVGRIGGGSDQAWPTPPGPITELFEQLDQLHLRDGRPSMREIAVRAGHGKISSSTVHNVFRSTKVPKWIFLKEIVKALHGDIEVFLFLWQAASQAENNAEKPSASPAEVAPLPQAQLETVVVAASQRIWSTEIPSRNPNFTGRVAELRALRANLVRGARSRPPAQIISGMGGIGKTEIAAEYIYLHRDKYEIIWWIRAEHHDRVRDSWSNWASDRNCGSRLRAVAVTGPSWRFWKRCSRESGPTGCWCTTMRRSPWTCKDTCLRSAGRSYHYYVTPTELARLHTSGQRSSLTFHRRGGR